LKTITRDDTGKAILQFQSEDGAKEIPYPEFNINELAPSTDERSYLHNYGAYAFEGGTGPEAYLSDANKTLNMSKPIRTLSKFQIGQHYWVAQQGYYFHSYYLGKEVPETRARVKAIHWLDCMNPDKNRRYKNKFLKAIPGYMYKVEALDNKPLLCLLQMNIEKTIDFSEYMKHDTKRIPYKDRVDSVFEEYNYLHMSDVYLFYDPDASKYHTVLRGGLTEYAGPSTLAVERKNGKIHIQSAKIRSMCYYAFKRIQDKPESVISLIKSNDIPFAEIIETNIGNLSALQALNKIEFLNENINLILQHNNSENQTELIKKQESLIKQICIKNASLDEETILNNITQLSKPSEFHIGDIVAELALNATAHITNAEGASSEFINEGRFTSQNKEQFHKMISETVKRLESDSNSQFQHGGQAGGVFENNGTLQWLNPQNWYHPYLEWNASTKADVTIVSAIADKFPGMGLQEQVNISNNIFTKVLMHHMTQDKSFNEQFISNMNNAGKDKKSVAKHVGQETRKLYAIIWNSLPTKWVQNLFSRMTKKVDSNNVVVGTVTNVATAFAVAATSGYLTVGVGVAIVGTPLVILGASFAFAYAAQHRAAWAARIESQKQVINAACFKIIEGLHEADNYVTKNGPLPNENKQKYNKINQIALITPNEGKQEEMENFINSNMLDVISTVQNIVQQVEQVDEQSRLMLKKYKELKDTKPPLSQDEIKSEFMKTYTENEFYGTEIRAKNIDDAAKKTEALANEGASASAASALPAASVLPPSALPAVSTSPAASVAQALADRDIKSATINKIKSVYYERTSSDEVCYEGWKPSQFTKSGKSIKICYKAAPPQNAGAKIGKKRFNKTRGKKQNKMRKTRNRRNQ